MNKLYHSFCVYSYKGGELCSNINQTIEWRDNWNKNRKNEE